MENFGRQLIRLPIATLAPDGAPLAGGVLDGIDCRPVVIPPTMVYTVIDCRPKQNERWKEIRRLRKTAQWEAEVAERKRWAAAWRLRARALREQREREKRAVVQQQLASSSGMSPEAALPSSQAASSTSCRPRKRWAAACLIRRRVPGSLPCSDQLLMMDLPMAPLPQKSQEEAS